MKSLFSCGVVIWEIDSTLSTIITRVLPSNILYLHHDLFIVSVFPFIFFLPVTACPLLMLIVNVPEH